MKNSEILAQIRGETRLHIWGRATGKTTKAVEILREDKTCFCIVPTLQMRDNYPRDVRERVVTIRQSADRFPLPGTRLIIDDIDCMPHVKNSDWMSMYRRYMITDVFKSPSNFLDWLTIKGTVDVKLNEKRQEETEKLVLYPWT